MMKKLLAILLCAMTLFGMLPLSVSAAGATVVYLKDGGTGDGSSPDSAVGTLEDAYKALDLSKDCTIVVCGPYTRTAHFSLTTPYTGSVLITSVYGGVDYAETAGAEYITAQKRFVLWGKTTFDHITFHLTNDYLLIVAQCNPIILGENIKVVADKALVNGLTIPTGLSIVGGYQNNQDTPEMDCSREINITVLGGEKIAIAAWNRALVGANHSGKANITIGGNAKVGVLSFPSVDADGTVVGDVELTVKDNATVEYLLGEAAKADVSVKSLTVNWLGGEIIHASTKDATAFPEKYTVTNTTSFVKGTVLNYSDAAASSANFSAVKAAFDEAKVLAPETTAVPETTAAPVTTAASDTTAPVQTPATADPAMFVCTIALLGCVACLALKKRERT